MKIKKFMEGITDLEHIANEFMTNVTVQVTNDANDKHTAIFMMQAPYSDKTREFTVMVNPRRFDELLIELDAKEDTFFKADITGFYTFLWHAAESDFGKLTTSIKTLTDPYKSYPYE